MPDGPTQQINNTVRVTGTDPGGTLVSAENSAMVAINHSPSLSLVKTSDVPSVSAVGQTITYTFDITNDGNVSLHGIDLNDPALGFSPFTCTKDGSGVTLADVTLAPGDKTSCTATKNVGQLQLDALRIPNPATVTGLDPEGERTEPAQSSAVVLTEQSPAMTLTKTADVTSVNKVGQVVNYTFTMVNTGNVTLTTVAISDQLPGLGAKTCVVVAPDGTQSASSGDQAIAPQGRMICTAEYTTTQADLDAGSIVNVAQVDGTAPAGQLKPVDSNPVVIQTITDPSIELVKSVAPARVANAGETVTYSLDITNNGDETLRNITVSDTMQGLTNFRCDNDITQPLAPSAQLHCMVDKVITADEMNMATLVNTATVTGDALASRPKSTSSATLVPVHTPKLALTKTHDVPSVTAAGDKVVFTFGVSNVGNIEISELAIDDPMLGSVVPTCLATTLDVGASTTCTATYVATQADVDRGRILNEASATGVDLIGNDPVVPGQASDEVPVTQDGALTITKAGRASATPPVLGDPVDFDIVVTNVGNVTLSDVTVGEDQVPNLLSLTCTPAIGSSLAPGATMKCLSTVRTTQADMDRGATTNIATADGKTPSGNSVPQVAATAQVPTVPGVSKATFTKTADKAAVAQVGDVVTYTFTATNTGNVDLFAPRVMDPMPGLSAQTCDHDADAALQPGETMVCKATKVVTQDDLDAGTLDNTATFHGTVSLTGTDVVVPARATVPATQQPGLSLAKAASVTTVNATGDVVDYSFRVGNSGNVDVAFSGITDALPGLGAVSCLAPSGDTAALPVWLAPGDSVHCTARYAFTQDAIDAGALVNQATARGTTRLGASVTSPVASAVVTVNSDPRISMTKTADRDLVQAVGDRITYTMTATNQGNVTLTGATISDPMDLEDLTCTPAAGSSLAPGATMTCTGVHTVVHADLEAAQVSNVATFTSNDPTGAPVVAEAGANVPALYNPKLEMTKSVSAPMPMKISSGKSSLPTPTS